MKVIEVENYDELSKTAGTYMSETLSELETPVLGLATGSTPEGLYQYMIEACKKGEVSFKHATTFNLDEYINVPADDPNSYHYFMNEKLFNHVDLPKERAFIPDGMAKDKQAECERYEEMIKNAGGIDLQILGIGANGHIGFNEPPSSFDSKTRIVKLVESTRQANARFFDNIEDVPTQAITTGIATIMKSKQIIMLISGKSKQEAYDRLINGEITEDFPASVLKKHANCVVIVDKEAAGK